MQLDAHKRRSIRMEENSGIGEKMAARIAKTKEKDVTSLKKTLMKMMMK